MSSGGVYEHGLSPAPPLSMIASTNSATSPSACLSRLSGFRRVHSSGPVSSPSNQRCTPRALVIRFPFGRLSSRSLPVWQLDAPGIDPGSATFRFGLVPRRSIPRPYKILLNTLISNVQKKQYNDIVIQSPE